MRSLELTLDPAGDAAVRSWWTALADAGLPSLAMHDAPSNRPHLTVAAWPTTGAEPRLQTVVGDRPRSLRFGGSVLFDAGRGRFVLARQIVVDADLAAFHLAVHRAVPDGEERTLPGRWTPHMTISRRLTPERVGAALTALAEVPMPETVGVAGIRLWDGETKTVTDLA
ncbi:2'-5' RNA ligase family protein [Curtobacterium sp. Leaf261]|uniref:2'-5' RNA ligase family protein n=1 Tax=Curtobacterium sp. Leaf261 TaxID=1736311 RepID=UPI0006F704F1|nr:2'-5' RNA ligase family protein [Curtobacterium sp. Leaf261]KQO62396.1 hypothetical protein ASF23_11525 [Curtobacterium sp. Leaf261]